MLGTPIPALRLCFAGAFGKPGAYVRDAERIGRHVARTTLDAAEHAISGRASPKRRCRRLAFIAGKSSTRIRSKTIGATGFHRRSRASEPARLLGQMGKRYRPHPAEAPLMARVTMLGGVACRSSRSPGEIFAETALTIRSAVDDGKPAFVICFADDNPGYIPPTSEFPFGGYEVDEAHRYYGLPMSFAPGA